MNSLNEVISLRFRGIYRLWLLWILISPLSIEAQTKVENESQLRSAVVAGGDILVTTNFSLGSTLEISKDVVLDLGGNTLKCEKKIGFTSIGTSLDLIKCSGSNIVIKNGSISAKFTNTFAGYVTAVQVNSGKTTIIDCNISGHTEGMTRSGTAVEYKGGNIQLIGGTFTGAGTGSSGKGYALYSESENVSCFVKGCLIKKGDAVQSSETKTIEGSITVSPINYNIKYDLSNGKITSSVYTTTYSILNDNETKILPTAEREHYKFLHWFNNSGSSINEDTSITETSFPYVDIDGKDDQTITFKAKWEALPYTIHFDTDGAGTIADGSYTVEDYPKLMPTPVRDGYIFTGWFNGNVPITSPFTFTGDITLKARWSEYKYALSYITKTETAPATQNYTKATSGSVKLPATWERKGYIFKGWYDNEKYEGNPITSAPCPQDGKSAIVTLSLYAKWEAVPYKLEYTLNDGSFEKEPDATYTIENTPYTLPTPKPTKEHSAFKGWYDNPEFSGKPITLIEKGDISNKHYYAKWLVTYLAECHWDSDTHPDLEDKKISFTKEDEVMLPQWDIVDGYEVLGWSERGSNGLISNIKKGTERNMELYAKWILAEYEITYEPYYGILPNNVIKTYTVTSEDIVLPYPMRSGFTFAGWYAEPTLVTKVEKQLKGSMGNKTYYAKWMAGNLIIFDKPENGKIVVKNGSTEIRSGEKIGANTKLTVTAIPDSSIYSLVKLTINGKDYTSSPQIIEVSEDKGLTVYAEFVDLRPSVSAPEITTNPLSTDFVPAGESVMVSLANMDKSAVLYYSIDGSSPKPYSQPFQISSLSADKTVRVIAYAKKSGCKDGVTIRDITFGKGKITITFNLPKGITAINPEGGEVVQAVASGGTFEFKLEVDKTYFESLEALRVEVDGKILLPNARNIYTLTNQTTNVVVKVSGITGITHVITLKQSSNGYISFAGEDENSASLIVNHGDRVSVIAEPDEGYKFFSWKNGSVDNPCVVTVEKDTVIQARFVQADPGYQVVLPTLIGAKVKPLTGYSTEVKKGGTFKFYISKESDYNESVPVVFANGEKLTIYKDVYSIYNITQNVVIAVDGIQMNKTKISLPDSVTGVNLSTGKDISEGGLTSVSMILIHAKAPVGKKFLMWNDGKVDNPRIITAKDAEQLLPLFVSTSDEAVVKIDLPTLVGAGVGAVNSNVDAITKGGDIQLKLVLLPQYSESQVKVTANGKELNTALSLRASSETKTLFYELKGVTEDMKVEVSGLKLNTYTVSLEQSEGGSIRASQSGVIQHGTEITLSATPVAGKMFMKWNNGNTLNPYKYTVTGDCVLSAQFIYSDLPVENETIQVSSDRVYTIRDILHIESSKIAELYIWNFSGALIKKVTVSNGHSTYHLPAGVYLVKVGDMGARKVIVR